MAYLYNLTKRQSILQNTIYMLCKYTFENCSILFIVHVEARVRRRMEQKKDSPVLLNSPDSYSEWENTENTVRTS